MTPPRTRFAPSPTGFMHIGNARTALFNWAFARRHGGIMVLRIEDTDEARSTAESEAAIFDGLGWLAIEWDEGPFRQSERRDRHRAAVEELLAKDRAYRCVCTREELEARKQATIAAGHKWVYDGRCRDANHGAGAGAHTVRLRMPQGGLLGWDDLVFGASGQDASEIGDMILRRSDGAPLYNLAVVVDDVDMHISHVIRGADHHSNTPLQLAIYRALGCEPPRFAHVPLIVGKDGKKLSKRRDPVSLQGFRAEGVLPGAMRNWLVRLGWSHGDQEIFSREEIARLFDLDAVHRSAAQADAQKLAWLNQQYIKTLARDELVAALLPFLEQAAGHPVRRNAELDALVELLRERSRSLVEMAQLARFLVVDEIAYDAKAAAKHLRPEIRPALEDLHARLEALEPWSPAGLEASFEEVRAVHGGLAMGKLAQPVRVAITGGEVSPPIFDTLAVLGKTRSLARIAEALHELRHG
ncbi:MAG TPA: glutamate--tRNA ligase [Myxococcota bacterium]|jgi:glutamyl-tRNA synthetase|nr:glutamate--tRNA ligase [Myxococcota bacterium]